MASVTATYGKKRSLFKSLASRRRQRYLAESMTAKKQGRRPASSRSCQDSMTRSPPTRQSSLSNAVDAMASALLDDSTNHNVYLSKTNSPGEADSSLRREGWPEPRIPCNKDLFQHRIPRSESSQSSQLPLFHRPENSAGPTLRAFPPGSGSLARAASTRPMTNHPEDWKHAGSKRPASYLNGPFLRNGGTDGLKKSCSVPLTNRITPRQGTSRSYTQGNLRAQNDALVIESKVSAMLAATDALKPSKARLSETPSRRSRNVGSKVIEKVSNVFDRLTYRTMESVSPVDSPTRTPAYHGQEELPRISEHHRDDGAANLISTIEIRLNEGDNLNRQKVQRIVGGQVSRKPVADDGKSLRSGGYIDDPFSEGGRHRKGNATWGHQSQKSSSGFNEILLPTPEEYFISEKGFYDDIDDGILSTTPVGSSTPRSRLTRRSTVSYDISPTHDSTGTVEYPQVAITMAVSKPVTGVGIYEIKPAADKAREKRVLDVEGNCWLKADTATGANVKECKRVKKHPSPSKRDLEDLEVALQRYSLFRDTNGGKDELDELCHGYSTQARHVVLRDGSSRMTSPLFPGGDPKVNSENALPTPWAPYYDLQTSPTSAFARSGQVGIGSRLAVPYRPPISCSNDVDELH